MNDFAPRWEPIECSARGASHLQSGLPNQDAVAHRVTPQGIVLAVSDGHGSAKCFRSDVGAKLAVEAAVHVLCNCLEAFASSTSDVEHSFEHLIPTDIVKEWRQRTAEHWSANPPSAIEEPLIQLRAVPNSAGGPPSIDVRSLPYGATLLVAVVTDDVLRVWQLGDGDILVVSDDRHQVDRPLQDDPGLIANETTSLCMTKAPSLFRYARRSISGNPPVLILMSTDGYANSFASDVDFRKVGSDLCKMIQASGVDAVREALPGWLNEASASGSGDDVTLGMLSRHVKEELVHRQPGDNA